jgi:multidrug resistance efflux pump
VTVAFDTAGTIGQMYVAEGDSIGENQLLAELRRVRMKSEFDTAKKTYTDARNKNILMEKALRNAISNGASDEGIEELTQSKANAQAAMDSALKKVNEVRSRMDATELRSPSKGVIKELLAQTHNQVEPGQTVVRIDPKDHFYLFNKSLAIFSFIAFWVFLGIHILAH